MVKGVNKRVIEINQTGNKFFEKIVIYLSPEYGDLSPAQLHKATESFSAQLRESTGALRTPVLRKKAKLRKGRVVGAAIIGLSFLGTVAGALIIIL